MLEQILHFVVGGLSEIRVVPADGAEVRELERTDDLVHLAPQGRSIFDVFNPRFDRLTSADGVEREDTPERRLPDGRTFRRTYRIAKVRWVDQVSESELCYYVDGKRYAQAFEMRWYLRAELEHLLARAGYRVRAMYGDFARGPLVDGAPEQVVVAERD